MGFRAAYTYDRKYMVDFSSAYVNSVKLAEGNRGGFSPSLGLAWLISSEDFMSSAPNVDFLKLRLSAGIINSDQPINGFYYRSEEHTSELQSLMRISYAVFCLKKKKNNKYN